jgi:hypothetical protein
MRIWGEEEVFSEQGHKLRMAVLAITQFKPLWFLFWGPSEIDSVALLWSMMMNFMDILWKIMQWHTLQNMSSAH